MQHPLQPWGGKGWEFPSAQSRTMAKVYFDSRPHPPPPDPRPFLWTVTVDKSRDDVPPRRLVALSGCDEIPRFVLEIKYHTYFSSSVPYQLSSPPFSLSFQPSMISVSKSCVWSHISYDLTHPSITRHVSLVVRADVGFFTFGRMVETEPEKPCLPALRQFYSHPHARSAVSPPYTPRRDDEDGPAQAFDRRRGHIGHGRGIPPRGARRRCNQRVVSRGNREPLRQTLVLEQWG